MSAKKRTKAQKRVAFAAWWALNRDKVNERRRQNYALTPGLRKKARTRVRKWRERQAQFRAQREERVATRRGRGPCRPKVFSFDGRDVPLYTIGVLLQRTGLSRRTLLLWEEKKIIPRGWHIDELDRRWYPEEYIQFMETIANMRADAMDTGGSAWFLANFKAAVIDLWFKVRGTLPKIEGVDRG